MEPQAQVRDDILSSWQRSAVAGLRPDRLKVPYQPDAVDGGPLSAVAAAVIDQAVDELDGTRSGLLLSDAAGHVIERRTPDFHVADRLDRVELAPGFVYGEEAVGTNAIGTAIAERDHSVVTGQEHFADALARFACAAAPVVGPAGQLVGVVDLSCDAADFHPLMVPMARRIARDIGGRLRRAPPPLGGWAELAPAERAVAELIARGYSVRMAAGQLGLPDRLVDRQLRRIFRKLGIRSRAELARIAEAVAAQNRMSEAVDDTRRQIERDLHDGLQQQLLGLGVRARAAELSVPAGHNQLKWELAGITAGLLDALGAVRDTARSIHPAILSERGLASALRALARNSPVPLELDLRVAEVPRLPQRIESGVYYVVSEALANVAKHAEAGSVLVSVEARSDRVSLSVADDGVGGADQAGRGLSGLRERIAGLGGTFGVTSPRGGGTRLTASVPVPASG